ncbi:MAG: hypothetical protein WCK89_18095 [bacterium]
MRQREKSRTFILAATLVAGLARAGDFVLVDDFESHTFGFDISSKKGDWQAHGLPTGTIVSNGNGQSAQLLGSQNAGYIDIYVAQGENLKLPAPLGPLPPKCTLIRIN